MKNRTSFLFILHQLWPPYLRLFSAIAAVVNGGSNSHYQGRKTIATQVVVFPAGILAFKHFNQHEVKVNGLQAHPGECCQEKVVKQPSEDGAGNLGLKGKEYQLAWISVYLWEGKGNIMIYLKSLHCATCNLYVVDIRKREGCLHLYKSLCAPIAALCPNSKIQLPSAQPASVMVNSNGISL